MTECPCCKQAVNKVEPKALIAYLTLSPTERIIAELTAQSFGQTLPSDRVIDAMYADREDGGPDNTERILAIMTFRLRAKLKPYGLTVGSRGGRGGIHNIRMNWL